MRNRLLAIVAAAVLTGAALPTAPLAQSLKILMNNLPPRTPFERTPRPPAPDYTRAQAWAALPTRADGADVAPRGERPARAPVADVFFVPPTTFLGGKRWNAAIDDAAVNARTDSTSLRSQASAFNACCAVYAPRYRQMVLGGYLRWSRNSQAASDLAYADVAAAFDHYLRTWNKGRPFIIAAHSQGSRHARRLIDERIDGRPVARRVVAAYLPGHWIERAWVRGLRDFHVCASPADTRCVASWSTYAEGNDASRQRRTLGRNTRYRPEAVGRDYVCTNPVSWTDDGETAPARANRGAWLYGDGKQPRAAQPRLVSVRCRDGAAYVSPPGDPAFTRDLLPNGNFHNYDYQLSYMNIRANAVERVAAFARR